MHLNISISSSVSTLKHYSNPHYFAAAFKPCRVPPVTARASDSANWQILWALQNWLLII